MRKINKLTWFMGVVVLAALAYSVGTASAAVRSCNTLVYKSPQRGPEVYVTSASNLTCKAAAAEQRRYKWTGRSRFTTPGGYVCRPSGRGRVGFQIRCVLDPETAPERVYRIEFVD